MRLSFLKRFHASTAEQAGQIARDADELMRHWGEAAYDRATYLSWEEDTGFVHSPRLGHWWDVRCEVGRRLDRQDRRLGVGLAGE